MHFAPILLCLAAAQPTTALNVELTFPKSMLAEPFTGRVFVIATKTAGKGTPAGLNWFNPQPAFAQDVAKWLPDAPLKFEPRFAHPKTWSAMAGEKCYLQAVLDRDLGGMSFTNSPGNLYSTPVLHDPAKPADGPIRLVLDQAVPERKFEEKPRVKLVQIESKLLSAFHKKPITMRAGVVLPKSFGESPEKKYPVIYEIPGFGGNHFGASNAEKRTEVAGVEMLYVVLDPSCRLGHHVFADSENNGPYGRALVEELIPAIEAKFRGVGEPSARFVTGHSSGGWSSLWLQVTHPDFFGGVWSTAPDPVDFRDFQRVNIYDPKQNLFTDEKGESRRSPAAARRCWSGTSRSTTWRW